MNTPTKIIATAVSLSAFAIAVVAGIAAGNSSFDVLCRALVAMFVCYVIGLVLGMIGERTVEEHVRQFINAQVVPDSQTVTPPADGGKNGGKLSPSTDAG